MALFTDPNVVTIDDLLLFESTLVQVSTTHSIDVKTKINLAIDGIGDQLSLALMRSGFGSYSPYGFVECMSYGLVDFMPAWKILPHLLLTPPIYRWICFESLNRIFAEAYNVQLNTRFQGKMNEYQAQAAQAKQLVFASPASIVNQPLSRPDAPLISVGVGTYSSPALFVQTTWADENGYESALSTVSGSVLNGFAAVNVRMTSPAMVVPPSAIGWNVYMSEDQKAWTRQNLALVPLGQDWSLPASGLISGPSWSGGQRADRLISLTPRVQRG